MKFQEIVNRLGELASENSLDRDSALNPDIKNVAAIDQAQAEHLSYIEGEKFAPMLEKTLATALILPQNDVLKQQATDRKIAWIATTQPRLVFAKAIALFYHPYRPNPGIHPTAIIASNVSLGKEVSIGAYVVIEQGVVIGDRVCIHPQVTIYPDAIIGDHTILHANCTIHERSQIGSNCVIHSGAAIGSEGFGFVPTEQGWYKMEQSGKTVLEDGVEIGCNTAVDRPAVGETRIKQNTKLDNLVQIGHGVTVGQNCALASQVGIAGGSTVGDRVLLGGQVGVANQVTIGTGTIVTAQSGVTHNIAANSLVSGTPAFPSKDFRKSYAVFKRLPEIYQTIKQVKKSLLGQK
ncbi:UDP-3-O-(3-hydroxymyristoyl) glucosamine N-acyltransferase [Xenococcus sp. PCC 7305]|uniref:UDP-3-O-(3-hydroxymyristoyl)glucosamine N-acyltransferase n=1 Tax=Xenococcus sp. PCC 7305 TaxID=102125 RepID=UPI0002AB9CA7|nr:UDP-3-O-(3-hydroxymyristoyl)glucosamine N-acyltransferase [Xenococcus sp. PCC 7305]ELS01465.1 UDP-3-O-(3-hydroxymyristoyl) glucosamine N-acyltransferase [Xenococcus sp. PCC 7305]